MKWQFQTKQVNHKTLKYGNSHILRLVQYFRKPKYHWRRISVHLTLKNTSIFLFSKHCIEIIIIIFFHSNSPYFCFPMWSPKVFFMQKNSCQCSFRWKPQYIKAFNTRSTTNCKLQTREWTLTSWIIGHRSCPSWCFSLRFWSCWTWAIMKTSLKENHARKYFSWEVKGNSEVSGEMSGRIYFHHEKSVALLLLV